MVIQDYLNDFIWSTPGISSGNLNKKYAREWERLKTEVTAKEMSQKAWLCSFSYFQSEHPLEVLHEM